MTALIYKAALPTYTSFEDLNANAGESLLLNDAGTAYELEPGQSGASIAGVGDWLYVDYWASGTQVLPSAAETKLTLLDNVNAGKEGGTSFSWRQATHDILVLRDCMVSAAFYANVSVDPDQVVVDTNRKPVAHLSINFRLKKVGVPFATLYGPGMNAWGRLAGDSINAPVFPAHTGDVLEAYVLANFYGPPGGITIDYASLDILNVGNIEGAS